MAAMATVTFTPMPSRPPPRGTVGVLGWLRANLFYSWSSGILTLVAGYLIVYAAMILYEWGIADAVWEASSRRECLDTSPDGACWAGIGVWFESFLYGRYPAPERWRVNLTFVILLLWLIPLWLPRIKARIVVGVSAAVMFPMLAAYLLSGGERGWLMHVTVPLGIVTFAMCALHVALCLGTGRSLTHWLCRLVHFERNADKRSRVLVACICCASVAIVAVLLRDWSLTYVKTNMWGGLFVTFLIAGVGVVVSLPAGILLALMRRSQMPFMRACVIGFIEVVRSVPLVTVLFFAVTMTPLFLPPDVVVDKLMMVLTAVSLFSAAYMAEVVRGGLQAIPLGQFEAAKSIGLGYWYTMRFVVLPQALRHMIPNITSQYIGLLKDTTVVSIVGLYDFLLMLRAAGQNPVWIGLYIEPFVFGGAVYFFLCYAVSRYSRVLERHGAPAQIGVTRR